MNELRKQRALKQLIVKSVSNYGNLSKGYYTLLNDENRTINVCTYFLLVGDVPDGLNVVKRYKNYSLIMSEIGMKTETISDIVTHLLGAKDNTRTLLTK